MVPRRKTAKPAALRAPGSDEGAAFTWRHKLPRQGPVDRHRFLLELAAGRRVVHVGFVDELMERKRAEGVWLHERLAGVASSLVGLDASAEGVERARSWGYEAQLVDAQSEEAVSALALEPADLIVAGEIIEHLDAPGPFLRALRPLARPDGLLVLTTPNAYRVLNFLAPVSGAELVHPDHTAWHSPQTLRSLLHRGGWQVEGMAYYRNPWRRVGREAGLGAFVAGQAANVARAALGATGRLLPYWSDGIVVWARPAPPTSAEG